MGLALSQPTLPGPTMGDHSPKDSPFATDKDKAASTKAREAGNAAFAQGNWTDAEAAYTNAIKHNPHDDKAWGNRAMVNLKLERWDQAELDASNALHIEDVRHLLSVKSLYRRGVARQASGKHAAAIRDLKRALTLDPNNVPIATKLLEVATQAGQASCAPAPPTPKLTIDHLAYPHIVDAIVSFSDAETRVALLDTCTAIQNRILKLCSHVEITEGSDSQGEYANIVQADGMSFRVYAKWRFQLPTTPSDRWTRICRDRIFLNSRTKDLCGPFTPDVIGYLEVDSGVVRMRPDQLDNHCFHNVCFMRESPTKIVVFPLHDSCAKDWFSISLSDSVTRIVYPLSMYWGPDSVPGVYTVPLVPRNDLYNPIVHRSPQDIPGVNPSLVMVIIWPTVNEVVSEELANPVFEQLLSQTCALIMVAFQSALHSVKVVNVAGTASVRPREYAMATNKTSKNNKNKGKAKNKRDPVQAFIKDYVSSTMFHDITAQGNPSPYRAPRLPSPAQAAQKVVFLTEEEYRSQLGPGEWEVETVEVMEGF